MSGILNVLVGAGGGDGSLYAFTDATFTPGTQTGVSGPDLTTARAGLTGTGVDAWKTNTAYFNTSSGYQLWTCPADGSYTITASGAAGGSGSAVAGRGITIQSTVTLVKGLVYKILVGQKGGINGSQSSGGGGGTFMAGNLDNVPVIVAGGGAGTLIGTTFANTTLSDAQSTTSGAASACGTGAGGTAGGGGAGSTNGYASGGGGFTTNGTAAALVGGFGYTGLGTSFTNGGTGGNSATTATGGFGGGGGTHGNTGGGGGGGGYSGGGGSNQAINPNNGGGGGSYSVGTITVTGYNTGQGSLTITKL
jgi:hypothetical protein